MSNKYSDKEEYSDDEIVYSDSSDEESSDNVEIDDEDHELFGDDCAYRYADEDAEEKDLDFEDDFDDDDYEDDILLEEEMNKNDRITKPFLTHSERVRLLSDRATQLAKGAKPLLSNNEGLSVKEIAELELIERIIPMTVKRPIPNKKPEIWKITEFEKI